MESKICTKCLREKLLSDFAAAPPSAPTKDGHLHRCKSCIRSYQNAYDKANPEATRKWQRDNPERMQKNKSRRIRELVDWIDGIKAVTPCTDCLRCFDPVCLDYDHVRGEKKFGVCQMIRMAYSRQAILDEIAKCE